MQTKVDSPVQQAQQQLNDTALQAERQPSELKPLFEDARPLVAQMKTTQAMMANSARVQNQLGMQAAINYGATGQQAQGRVKPTLQMNSDVPVVQRVIEIDNKIYGSGDEDVFNQNYNETHRAAILTAIKNNISNYPQSIKAALQEERRITLTLEEDDADEYDEESKEEIEEKKSVFYYANASEAIKAEEGGNIQEALSEPQMIKRPAKGYEKIFVAGLITCVGIFIDASDEQGRIQAATGSHFVTSSQMTLFEDYWGLNESGVRQIDKQLGLLTGYKNLSAYLCFSGDCDGKTDAALKEIKYYLGEVGVSKIVIRSSAGTVTYQLHDDGKINIEGMS